MYVDTLLSSRRGNSPVTYLALVLVYFTLMGMGLYLEYRTLIGAVGLGLLIALLLGVWALSSIKRSRAMLPGLGSFSPSPAAAPPPAENQTLIRPADSAQD